jgi:hypothetical protein
MSQFPKTKATDLTELVMQAVKKKLPDMTTHQYNRTYEAVYDTMAFIHPDEKDYRSRLGDEVTALREDKTRLDTLGKAAADSSGEVVKIATFSNGKTDITAFGQVFHSFPSLRAGLDAVTEMLAKKTA